MRTVLVIIAVVALFALSAGVALAGVGPAESTVDCGECGCDGTGPYGPNISDAPNRGPAPNAGDGIPDGSGF